MTPETRTRLKAASITERNAAIRQAAVEGATLREIADIVGMSFSGVRNIIKKGAPS